MRNARILTALLVIVTLGSLPIDATLRTVALRA